MAFTGGDLRTICRREIATKWTVHFVAIFEALLARTMLSSKQFRSSPAILRSLSGAAPNTRRAASSGRSPVRVPCGLQAWLEMNSISSCFGQFAGQVPAMSTLQEIETASLRLPKEDLLHPADTILGNLPPPPTPAGPEEILAEAIRRDAELESGQLRPLTEAAFWAGVRRHPL